MIVPENVLAITHHFAEKAVSPGDTVIDATMGNGHDTLFLSRLVGEMELQTGFIPFLFLTVVILKCPQETKPGYLLYFCCYFYFEVPTGDWL